MSTREAFIAGGFYALGIALTLFIALQTELD